MYTEFVKFVTRMGYSSTTEYCIENGFASISEAMRLFVIQHPYLFTDEENNYDYDC